jgi:hypothetical protein
VSTKDVPAGATLFNITGRGFEKLGIERRAEMGARDCLAAEPPGDGELSL